MMTVPSISMQGKSSWDNAHWHSGDERSTVFRATAKTGKADTKKLKNCPTCDTEIHTDHSLKYYKKVYKNEVYRIQTAVAHLS